MEEKNKKRRLSVSGGEGVFEKKRAKHRESSEGETKKNQKREGAPFGEFQAKEGGEENEKEEPRGFSERMKQRSRELRTKNGGRQFNSKNEKKRENGGKS